MVGEGCDVKSINECLFYKQLQYHVWKSRYLRNKIARLFVKLPRPEDSEETFSVFESSCHLLQLKEGAILLNYILLKETTSKLAILSLHYSFNVSSTVQQENCDYHFLRFLVWLDEEINSGVAVGQVDARDPGRSPWGRICTHFTVIQKLVLSKNLDHSLLKNEYFSKEKNKNK